MENIAQNFKVQNCKQHNQPKQFFGQDIRNQMCITCVLQKVNAIPIEQMYNQYQKVILTEKVEIDSQLQWLHIVKDNLFRYKTYIQVSLDKIIQYVIDQIAFIQSQIQSIKDFEKILQQYESTDQLQTYININLKSHSESSVRLQVKNCVHQHSRNIKFKQKFYEQISNNCNSRKDSQKLQQFLNNEIRLDSQENTDAWNFDFAFYQKNQTLIAATEFVIKTCDFQNGKIGKQFQTLKKYTLPVVCLYYMKNKNCLVSGSYDHSIIIWQHQKNNQWKD